MSHPDPHNPYASPTAPPVALSPASLVIQPIHQMEYFRAYNYIFENPNWIMNVLMGFLCILSTMIIPLLGQLLFMGYQFEVAQGLLMTQGTRYPHFDLNRFGDYLMRSLYPFVVSLVFVLPLVVILAMGIGMVTAVAAAAGGDEGEAVAGLLVIPLMFFGMLAFWLVIMMFVIPLMMRAGLQQEFGAGFDFAWAFDFFKRTWLEILLSALFLAITGMVLVMVGMLALCIGMFAAQAIVMLAQAHFWYQLYALYLGRGGQPIPLKPMPMPL
jgi:hypothetical protein